MTTQEIEGIFCWLAIGLLYLLRNTHPIFEVIWKYTRLLLLTLLIILTVNYAKDKIKGWWKS
jgi:hypothetical protein